MHVHQSHIGLQFVQFAHEFSVVGSFTNDRNPRLRLEERANCSSDRFGVVSYEETDGLDHNIGIRHLKA